MYAHLKYLHKTLKDTVRLSITNRNFIHQRNSLDPLQIGNETSEMFVTQFMVVTRSIKHTDKI